MSGELSPALAQLVAEAAQLRLAATLPGAHASGDELLGSLLDVRAKLDRMEELLGNVLRVRAHALARHTVARIRADDAWDEAAVKQRSAAVRDEYSSAKERAAATNLEVLDLRRTERAADADARACDEAVEQIRLRYRGLADVRQDIHTIVRARQFESTLDR